MQSLRLKYQVHMQVQTNQRPSTQMQINAANQQMHKGNKVRIFKMHKYAMQT